MPRHHKSESKPKKAFHTTRERHDEEKRRPRLRDDHKKPKYQQKGRWKDEEE